MTTGKRIPARRTKSGLFPSEARQRFGTSTIESIIEMGADALGVPLKTLLGRWGLTSIKINAQFLEAEFVPRDADRGAAWELYVELLTRTTTQELADADGEERSALESLHGLFGTTREILRRRGPECVGFSKIAIPVLNQIVRPFTSRWHPIALSDEFDRSEVRQRFRRDLAGIRPALRGYAKALADLAMVEDLSSLED